MDRRAWWATVHGVAKSRTWQTWLSMQACKRKENKDTFTWTFTSTVQREEADTSCILRVCLGKVSTLCRLSTYLCFPSASHYPVASSAFIQDRLSRTPPRRCRPLQVMGRSAQMPTAFLSLLSQATSEWWHAPQTPNIRAHSHLALGALTMWDMAHFFGQM